MSLGVAVVGLGHWGPNYLRVIDALQGVSLVAAVDLDEERKSRLQTT